MSKSNLEVLLSRSFTINHKGAEWRVTHSGRLEIVSSKAKIEIPTCEYSCDLGISSTTLVLSDWSRHSVKLTNLPPISDASFIPTVIDQAFEIVTQKLTTALGSLS